MFIWLSDVPEDHGPTRIVPLPVTAGVPALPHGYLRSERPDCYAREQSAAGPAGTVVAYSTETFRPDWNPFVEQATSRQLQLFGFPPPGHPYWTADTIAQLQLRYPGLDTSPWSR
jgi:hypothetical protein